MQRHVEGPDQSPSGFHATDARVSNFARNDLRAGSDAVEFGLLHIVAGDDAGDVCAMGAAWCVLMWAGGWVVGYANVRENRQHSGQSDQVRAQCPTRNR